MRTLVNIPDDDLKWLDAQAARRGKSRAAVVREAVSIYRSQTPATDDKGWIELGAGYWADRKDIGDGLAYQCAIREDQDLGFPWPPQSSTPIS